MRTMGRGPAALTAGVLAAGLVGFTLLAGAGSSVAAGACEGYPYAGSTSHTDPNGFYAPDVRSYVASCLDAGGRDVARIEKGPNGKTADFQKATPGQWSAAARSIGLAVRGKAFVLTVAELGNKQTVLAKDESGKSFNLRGPFLGAVVAVYSKGSSQVRSWDSAKHAVVTYTLPPPANGAPRFVDFTGGEGVRNGHTSTSPTPRPTHTRSPSPRPTHHRSPSPSPTRTKSPTETPTAIDTTTPFSPSVTSSPPPLSVSGSTKVSKHDVLAVIAGVLLLLVAGLALRKTLERPR